MRAAFLIAAVYFSMSTTNPVAQVTQDAKAASASSAVAPETVPQVEAAKVLRALEGTWSITEDLAADAKSPNGGKGEGQIVWRPGPGGYSIVEDYQSREGDHDISGLGVLWWDDAAHGFRTIWCDSTNPGGCISFKSAIHWEGANLVLMEDYEIKGKKFTFKEVFGDITPQTFTQTLYGAEAGKPLKVDQVIHAKRIGPSRAGKAVSFRVQCLRGSQQRLLTAGSPFRYNQGLALGPRRRCESSQTQPVDVPGAYSSPADFLGRARMRPSAAV